MGCTCRDGQPALKYNLLPTPYHSLSLFIGCLLFLVLLSHYSTPLLLKSQFFKMCVFYSNVFVLFKPNSVLFMAAIFGRNLPKNCVKLLSDISWSCTKKFFSFLIDYLLCIFSCFSFFFVYI